jgi:hypothetical protein
VSLPARSPAPAEVLGPAGALPRPGRSAALRVALPIVFAVAVLATPLAASGYPLREATTILMYMALALSWNLIGGMCGYPSVGQVACFGIGARSSDRSFCG